MKKSSNENGNEVLGNQVPTAPLRVVLSNDQIAIMHESVGLSNEFRFDQNGDVFAIINDDNLINVSEGFYERKKKEYEEYSGERKPLLSVPLYLAIEMMNRLAKYCVDVDSSSIFYELGECERLVEVETELDVIILTYSFKGEAEKVLKLGEIVFTSEGVQKADIYMSNNMSRELIDSYVYYAH